MLELSDKAIANEIFVLNLLKKTFKHFAVAIVSGEWKTGKTDFGLLLSELLISMKFIKKVASNIDTMGYYPKIYELPLIRKWIYADHSEKLYILDEGNEHMTNRRVMSRENVGIIQLLPELSKAHCRLIMICHDSEKVDPEFNNKTWLRAIFHKVDRTTIQIQSKYYDDLYTLYHIPRTSIPFDPDQLAPFSAKIVEIKNLFKGQDKEDWEMLKRYFEGESFRTIGLANQEGKRLIIKKLTEYYNLLITNNINMGEVTP